MLGVGLLGVLVNHDAPAEDALGAPRENALEELAAVAVRLDMFDPQMVVHELRATDHVQAVERAGTPLTVQHGADVVAHQGAAEQNRMRGDIAVSVHLQMQSGDVERLLTLSLDLDVVHDGVVAGDQFRHGVGEILSVAD